jgi:hypothetical protein
MNTNVSAWCRLHHTSLCGITYSICISERIRFLIRNYELNLKYWRSKASESYLYIFGLIKITNYVFNFPKKEKY